MQFKKNIKNMSVIYSYYFNFLIYNINYFLTLVSLIILIIILWFMSNSIQKK